MRVSGGITLSALRALGTKIGVNANNIANMETIGFKRRRAILEEGRTGGIDVVIEKVGSPGPGIGSMKKEETVAEESSNVELTEEIPQLTHTQRSYKANLQVIDTQEEMMGTIIDILG